MSQATPETLLDMALARAPAGRNNAGFWLAQQLHANGYSQADAEAVMCQYAASVGGAGKDSYTEREARATLKAEYRREAKDPWSGGSGGGPGSWQERRAHKARQSFPTAPPARRDPEPNPDSVERFRRESKRVKKITGTPAAAYLESRGIPEDLARAARCAYAPAWGSVGQAVVFPIVSEAGKSIAANGRAITETTPDKQKRTYGPKIGGAFLTPGALEADPVAITEAPIDALTLALAGLPAIALCGTSGLPSWLIKRLGIPAADTPAGHSRTVYLAFDNDQAGETAAARIGAAMPLVRTVRLRPKGKDWNEDLTTGGLGALREWLEAAGTNGKATQYPAESPEASESSPVASVGHCVCDSCGAAVALNAYPEGNGWHWYECDSCGESAAILSIPEEAASESNPTAPFCDPGGEVELPPAPAPVEDPSPAAMAARMEALAETIRASLAGRPLPIAIKPGESITGIDLYAVAEARSALSKSRFLAAPALERLALLGIDVSKHLSGIISGEVSGR